MMNRILLVLSTSFLLMLSVTELQAQCPNDNTLFGTTTPICDGVSRVATTAIFAGEYRLFNVTAGNTYVFSTCGDPDFDTYLTVFNNTGGTLIAFNDNFCGLQSQVTWIASFTGQVRVLVDAAGCTTNSIPMTLNYTCTPPPVNDNPCGAIALPLGSSCNPTQYSTVSATATAGIPAPGCANYLGGDVWFTFVAPTNGIVSLETEAGVITDADMAVYSATACGGTYTLVACDDLSGAGLMPQLALTGLIAGQTYYVRVWEYGNNVSGTFGICASSPPANDNPCNAINLNSSGTCNMTQYTMSGATSTNFPTINIPSCGNYLGGDVWFSTTVPANGQLSVLMETTTSADYSIAIYTATSCSGTFTEISCDDDAGPGFAPAITINSLAPGTAVYIRAWEDGNDNNGTFSICASNAPINDNPCFATNLSSAGLTCVPVTGTNVGATATTSPTIPAPGCSNYLGGDIWYSTTMPSSGTLIIESTASSLTDGAMAIYTLSGTCSTGTYNLVSCDDDAGPGLMPLEYITNVPPGTPLYIRFFEYGNNVFGNFGICAHTNSSVPACGSGAPSAADECTYATPVCDLNGYCGNTSSAYTTSTVAPYCGSIENNSWLSFVAAQATVSMQVTVSACSAGNGIQMALYTTTNCTSFTYANASSSNCYFQILNNQTTAVNFTGLTPGATYYLMIDGYAGDVCDYSIAAVNGAVYTNVNAGTDINVLPGCSFSLTATGGNGVFTWTPGGSSGATLTSSVSTSTTYTATSSAGNELCPNSTSDQVRVNVVTPTIVSNSPVCPGALLNLSVLNAPSNTSTYAWSGPAGWTGSGSAQVVGGMSPLRAGTYTVTITTTNGCTATASTVVSLAAGFSTLPGNTPLSATVVTNGCAGTSAQFNVQAGASYVWSGPNAFSSTLQNPAIPSLVLANGGTYQVTVTSVDGCTATDHVSFDVTQLSVSVTSPDVNICRGETTALNAATTVNITSVYGPTGTSCGSTPTILTLGTGATGTTVGSPFRGVFEDGRFQYLYTATEVIAFGAPQPFINSIAFNSLASSTTSYNFQVRIGQVAVSDFSGYTNFEPNMYLVASGVITPALGWNTIVFDNPYRWNSLNNIVVEFSFDNEITGTTSQVQFTSTSNTVLTQTISNSSGFTIDAPTISSNRPNIQFGFCMSGGISQQTIWSPTLTLDNFTGNNVNASPTATTTYTATYQVNACSVSDAITITVLDPSTIASNTGPYCVGSTMAVTTTSVGPLSTYSWSGPGGFTSSSQSFTRANVTTLMSGLYTVTATINGCTTTASTFVDVRSPSALTLTASPSVVCPGGTTQLNASYTPNVGAYCGLFNRPCGPSADINLGSGTLNTFAVSPFRGSAPDAKLQVIYTAADLLAAGLTAGKINGIQLDVVSFGNTTFNNFTIGMACTSVNAFATGGTLNTGISFSTVYSNSVNPASGLNNFVFAQPYEWDGSSNLIIQFCYDNVASSVTDNIVYTNVAYNASALGTAFTGNGCNLVSGPGVTTTISTQRPNIIFNQCAITSPTVTYTWAANPSLSATNIANPMASPTATTSYSVMATDGICTVSNSIPISLSTLSVSIASSDNNICPGRSITLTPTVNTGACGASGICAGPSTSFVSGTTSSNTSILPFAGGNADFRAQSIYRASELYAAGLRPGLISQIAVQVNTKGSTQPYNNFSVKIGCTAVNTMVNGPFISTGMTTVFTGNYSTFVGLNTFAFSIPWLWDGTSNIVIEFCYDNTAGTGNDLNQVSSPGYNSTLYSTSGCTAANGITDPTRPNLRFFSCASYAWSTGSNLASITVNPLANTTYTLTVSDGQCTASGSININTVPVTATVTPATSTICAGASTVLTASMPATLACGITGSCSTTPIMTVSGTTSSNTSILPFAGGNADFRAQSIYRASELIAAGVQPGLISQIGIQVNTKSSTQPYNNFTVKIGCTSLTALSNGAFTATGMTTVFTGNYNTFVGLNTFAFSTPWYWDGTSNLLVEFCYDNATGTANDLNQVSSPGYNSTLYSATGASGCTIATGITDPTRPNLRFYNCSSFSWASGETSRAITVSPTANTTYTVTVSDGVCVGTGTATVNVINLSLDISPSTSTICAAGTPVVLNPTFNQPTGIPCGQTAACSGASATIISGVTTSISNIAPFSGGSADAKRQMIYRASELQAQGMQAGYITNVSVTVSVKNSTQPYNNFTVSIGCTSLNEFNVTTFQTGLTTVFNANYSSVTGLNTFNFSSPWYWDGTSNIILEFCYDNATTNNNDFAHNTTPAFVPSLRSTTNPGCAATTGTTLPGRVNVRFGMCYGFSWSNGSSNASLSVTPASTTMYTVTVSQAGCTATASATVYVSTLDVSISGDNSICPGASTTFTANVTGNVPQACATAPACTGNGVNIASGAFSGTTLAFPFNSAQESRMQTIYSASDLLAQGLVPGPISSISLFVATKGSNVPFSGFTVKMDCTSLPDFASGINFIPGLNQVFSGNVTTSAGAVNIALQNAYYWDGFSNLVIEFCYDNAVAQPGSDLIRFTSTALVPTLTATSTGTGTGGCFLVATTTRTQRPLITLQQCSNATLAWSTGATSADITVSPAASTTYTVTATDGLCTVSESVALTLHPLPSILAGNTGPVCRGSSVQFSASGAQTYTWTGPGGYTNTGPHPDRDNISLAQAGTYAVQGTDANGCQNSATTNLVVNICPELCTNGIDDDGDGLIDFDDPDCPCND
jgi:hypothetical protein